MNSAIHLDHSARLKSMGRHMRRSFKLILSLSLVSCLVIIGCNRPSPAPAPVVSTANSPSTNIELPDIEKADSAALLDPEAASSDSGEGSKDLPTVTSDIPSTTVPIPEGSWTKQRLIALTYQGPVVIDLMLRVGGMDLDAANEAAVQPIQTSLLSQLGENAKWEPLLDLPLIKSGWLGNLIPEEGQVTQLIGMYDKNKDAVVQASELTEFLTRGLSRAQPLRVADSGSETNSESNRSPFGVLDSDGDNVLSAAELKGGAQELAKLDFNGDSNVSLSEIEPMSTAPAMASSQMGISMLRASSLVFHQPALNADEKSDRNQQQRKVIAVKEHYSFLNSIERQQWPGWSDSQWKLVDKDNDGQITESELAAIFRIDPFVKIAVDIASPYQEDGQTTWYCDDVDPRSIWASEKNSGQLNSTLCNMLMNLEDAFVGKMKTVFRNRLNEALKNAQVKQFLIQQLQLKDNALDVVDADNDQSVSDSELENAWHWLVARQSARVQARWMLAGRPWFQLLDNDRNQSISEIELSRISDVLGKLDSNQDGVVASNELPLVVRFTLARQDQRADMRGLLLAESSTSGGEADADWFSAMDTNRDGSIGKQEFLGTNSEFQGLDRDGDGFISQSEVY
jgi:Ca2+-binding EF-hand superfamily protein